MHDDESCVVEAELPVGIPAVIDERCGTDFLTTMIKDGRLVDLPSLHLLNHLVLEVLRRHEEVHDLELRHALAADAASAVPLIFDDEIHPSEVKLALEPRVPIERVTVFPVLLLFQRTKPENLTKVVPIDCIDIGVEQIGQETRCEQALHVTGRCMVLQNQVQYLISLSKGCHQTIPFNERVAGLLLRDYNIHFI